MAKIVMNDEETAGSVTFDMSKDTLCLIDVGDGEVELMTNMASEDLCVLLDEVMQRILQRMD